MATKIIMPEMGEGITEAIVAQWLKEEGERVEQYEPILEIETDKVTTEATAETAGILLQIYVAAGETAVVGTLLGLIGQPGEGVSGEPDEVEVAAAKQTVVQVPSLPKPKGANGRSSVVDGRYMGRISPVVGRIAAENGVDLNRVTGSGKNGRITKKDVLAYIEQEKSAPASPQSGAIVPLTSMRRGIADHMVRSKRVSPHVTTVFEFDFTAVFKHRAAHKEQFAQDGVRLTFTAYLVAATVQALKQHPLVNSTWSDDGIRLLRDINVGMATALDDGLIVPVIKNADSLNLLGIARAVNDLAQRARSKQLRPDEVQDGTFTITNHGVSGSLFATPIINQPQCGILGVGIIEKRVKVINNAIAIRPLAYVSLTFDHRILDGAMADYFVASIKKTIENWG